MSLSQSVYADIISAGAGNRIHFINTKSKSGSDAILLESNGHYALIDMGEDYDFPDGSNQRYPNRWGISMDNDQTLEDRLFRHLEQVGVKRFDFILGTHVHSDHIGAADEVLKRYPVDRFYLKRYSDERITSKWRLWDNLYNYDNAVRTALERGVRLMQDISAQDSHFTLGDMDIQLYNYENEYEPQNDETDVNGNLKKVFDDNSNSIVAVVTVAGKKIYLGGDLDNAEGAEDKLGPVIGKVDMMKWNHHYDAKISNTVNFIENLSPNIVVQTSGADINRESTLALLREKNIKIIKAFSRIKDATVFDISEKGFTNVSDIFPDIPSVSETWYQEDGYWKYRLSDDQMAIGWQYLNGSYYFFNGKGQMQANRWLHLHDSQEKLEGNWYYLNTNGQMQTSGWFKHDGFWYYITSSGARKHNELVEIEGQKYLFDKDGKMLTGHQVFNGKKMFFANSGALQTGEIFSSWKQEGSNWYYYDEDGDLTVGLKKINGETYYFDNDAVMQTGWSFIEDHWSYFASSGAMQIGWIKDQDTWYYLNKEGVMLTGSQEINGTHYYLNTSGAMQVGWQWFDNSWHYYNISGAMMRGWFKDQDTWYYLNKEGVMLTGSQEINGTRYYLNTSGAMQVGWQWFDNSWHYYNVSGAMMRGWFKDQDTWYYLESKEGNMLVGLHKINGESYYFNRSGAMKIGWQWFDNHYHYFVDSGEMKKGWIKDQGIWYYLDTEDGIMLVGLQKVNGKTYYFESNGAMQTGWKKLNGNWYYFQTDGSLLRNSTTPDGYQVNADGVWETGTPAVSEQLNKQEPSTVPSASSEKQPYSEANSSYSEDKE